MMSQSLSHNEAVAIPTAKVLGFNMQMWHLTELLEKISCDQSPSGCSVIFQTYVNCVVHDIIGNILE